MRLAVIDFHGDVLISWPTTQEAHVDLADLVAARLHPGRFRGRRRGRVAAAIRAHLLELQEQTRTLQVGPSEAAPTV